MKKVSSAVWQFFDRIEQNGKCVSVACKICDNAYKYFGNTTNLRIHLSKKHPLQWEFRQINIEGTTPVVRHVVNEPKRKSYASEAVETDTDTEVENAEEDAETQNMVKQIHATDEEWLEEDYVNVSYEPKIKKKKMRRNIKREIITPPQEIISRKRKSTAVTSPIMHRAVGGMKDEYDTFGEYVANKIRNLGKSRAQGNVQQIIGTILWQAEFGTYDSVDTVKRVLMSSMQETEKPEQVSELNAIEVYSTAQVANDDDINAEIDHNPLQNADMPIVSSQ